MNNNKAIFIVGSPGSGKDVVIRDITSNYNLVEFTSTQINEMLSLDSSFKKAKLEKQNALLEQNSILVNCKSYELGFFVTKHILEGIGYSTHLILVEADISVAFDRIKNRNLQESLDKISIGNNNKNSIMSAFEESIIVDNSKQLDLTECRHFVSELLDNFIFESNLTLEKCVDKKELKSKIKSKIVPLDRVSGDIGTLNFLQSFESIDSPELDGLPVTSIANTDDPKKDKSAVLKSVKKTLFTKRIPNVI